METGRRELTLGEEIINLVSEGVDATIVERIFRKYIELTSTMKQKEDMRTYWANDELAVKECLNETFGVSMDPAANMQFFDDKICLGAQIEIPLIFHGIHTATVHKITDKEITVIFNDYVTMMPMNKKNTNVGGFKHSDLYKWLYGEFLWSLPFFIRRKLVKISIPSVGEMFGWDDDWARDHYVIDADEQLLLMKERKNRFARYGDEFVSGWLRNKTHMVFSSSAFASVSHSGGEGFFDTSENLGVRPVLILKR